MNNTALYIVRQNFDSKCFKCKKEKKFFTVYRCGKCNPQTIEKYCYECCEESLIVKEGEDSDDDDTNHISALCMGCAFCYDYILVSEFYKKEKENGWQSLKYDCGTCTCCCGGNDCITGSICCCIPNESDDSEEEEEEEEEEKEEQQQEKEKEEKEEEEKEV